MRHPMRYLLASLAAAGLLTACADEAKSPQAEQDQNLVSIAAGERSIRMSGQFMRGQAVVSAPVEHTRISADFSIMRRQVSQAEYAECVADKGCKVLDKANRNDLDPNLPVVGVSWLDARDYAKWFSRKTGQNYRLPTYVEWAHAAGSAFEDIEVIDVGDSNNPALRWLAEYAAETARASSADNVPKPFGTYGVTSTGVQDIGGNVWDWTDTCFTTHAIGDGDTLMQTGENCGIRVLAGKHIGYIIDFIRDPTSGACSVGIPPNNLGIRLVLDTTSQSKGQSSGKSLMQQLGLS